MSETPVELLNGVIECNVGGCSHTERYFHPVAGLISMQDHCEEEHGVPEKKFVEEIEQLAAETEQ